MRSWWWWIDLARWHISFPPRRVPWPKRWEGCFSCTCSSIMASLRTLCWIKTESSQASFSKPYGSAWAQSSKWAPLSTPNRWKDWKSELGYLIIPKELLVGKPTRLGWPFGVGRILLQQFKIFGNKSNPFSNGDGQVTNCAHNLGNTSTTRKWCKWGSVNGYKPWWRGVALMGDGQNQSWKDT